LFEKNIKSKFKVTRIWPLSIKAYVDDKTKPSEVFKITKKMKNKYAYFSINDN
jgi:hypothetical protein